MDFKGQPIGVLHGVGKVKAAAYEKLGIRTLGDLVGHFPRAYENRGDICLLSEAREEGKSAVILTVATEPRRAMIRRGMTLLKFRAFDESGTCEITYYNQDYLRDRFTIGATFRFFGRVEKKGKRYAMSSPVSEAYVEGQPLPPLVALYPLTEGLSQHQVTQNIESALSLTGDRADPLPNEIRTHRGLCTLKYALRNIHFPEDYAALSAAKKRLIYDELFAFSLGMATAREKTVRHGAPVCRNHDLSRYYALLPYTPTGAQSRVIGEIARDMETDVPMCRMVVGDVGCGKTVCAAAAMLIAIQSGRQAALMAPTEILARQHYAELKPYFEALGYSVELLVGAVTPANKRKIYERLSGESTEGRLDAVIGTQALLSAGVRFAVPGLVVTDEQHRFGVGQRAGLSEKSGFAHLLVMSATPIPRSLALTLYGDLAVSAIDEMPPGRQRVDTFCVDESYRERILAFIRKQVEAGGQVYVVCPAVEEQEAEPEEVTFADVPDISPDGELSPGSWEALVEKKEQPPLKAAVTYAGELAERLPGTPVGFVHGKMKSAEKDSVMNRFAHGDIKVLVSTTVIEVGVNVPNATLMIVENADRFGLSQLHQLRGRVGRGSRKSYCILVSDSRGETAKKRLSIMCSTYDGFKIAEEDLLLRGPGDFLSGRDSGDGIRQSGGIRFRLAEWCTDAGLLKDASEDAKALLASDPALAGHPELKETVDRLFSTDAGMVS